MSEKLKPCPFCGGIDIRFDKWLNNNYGDLLHHPGSADFKYIWSTCCYGCGATFPNRYNKQILIDQWNRRPKQKTTK